MKFKFGDRILVKGNIVRHRGYRGYNVVYHYWQHYNLSSPQKAIFLKLITLRDGKLKDLYINGEERGQYLSYDKIHKGAWICREGFKPEKVFLEDIEPEIKS